MKKLFIVLISLTCLNLFSQPSQKSDNKETQKKEISCKAGAPSWQPEDQCKAEEGNWVAPDEQCEQYPWLGEKPEGNVCCVGCTDDGLEEAGID